MDRKSDSPTANPNSNRTPGRLTFGLSSSHHQHAVTTLTQIFQLFLILNGIKIKITLTFTYNAQYCA